MHPWKPQFILLLLLSTGLALILTFSPSAGQAATSSAVEVGLAIDGSPSISQTDFTLQKAGIVQALNDPLKIPRNGTIAVTIIQFDKGARVEIPYTVIDSEFAAQRMIGQVNRITQMFDGTGPGAGIQTAWTELAGKGDPTNEKIICLSTDGLPNRGPDTPTVVAQVKSAGLDRLSFVAVEDPPNNFYAPDFENYYGPLAFGGGNVTVVANSTQYAESIGGCFTDALELVALEVNQAIQNWRNDVNLVEHKKTYVRAHIQSVAGSGTHVSGLLYGTRQGAPLPGSPLSASAIVQPAQDAIAERHNWDATLNFRLPTSWLSGNIELDFWVPGNDVHCQEPAEKGGIPNDCIVKVEFIPVDPLDIKFVGIQWTDDTGFKHVVFSTDVIEVLNRLHAILPVSQGTAGITGQITIINWDGPVPFDHEDVLAELETMRALDGCTADPACKRLYVGILRGSDILNGSNGTPGTVSVSRLRDNPLEFYRNSAAHELAHSLNRHHAIDTDLGVTNGSSQGHCRELASPDAPGFLYFEEINGRTYATIGPLSLGETAKIYGLDTYLLGSGFRDQAVVNPQEHFELMSYCGLDITSWRWISDFTYEGLLVHINNRFLSTAERAELVDAAAQGNEAGTYDLVRLTVDLQNNVATFAPLTQFTAASPPAETAPGDYTLKILDAEGILLDEISFMPNTYTAELGEEGAQIAHAMIPLESGLGAAALVVEDAQGVEIGEAASSENRPEVSIIYPNGGELLNEEQIELEWQSSDADDDDLSASVQYSADGGLTWETLAVDLPAASYTLQTRILAGSETGLIRVIVSDGFLTAVDESDGVFTVGNHAPEAAIVTPLEDNLVLGSQPISLEARSFDPEAGQLTGDSLVWESSEDGVLGSGEQLDVPSTDLSEGRHLITLTATDEDGSEVKQRVPIYVYRFRPPETSIFMDVSADASEVSAGDTVTYTAVIRNTGQNPAVGLAMRVEMPDGFTYLTDSSAGIPKAEPFVDGQTLLWPGPYTLEAGEEMMFSFQTRAADQAGYYFTELVVNAINVSGRGTGPVSALLVKTSQRNLYLPAVLK